MIYYIRCYYTYENHWVLEYKIDKLLWFQYLHLPSLFPSWPITFSVKFSLKLEEVGQWLAVLTPYVLHINKIYKKIIFNNSEFTFCVLWFVIDAIFSVDCYTLKKVHINLYIPAVSKKRMLSYHIYCYSIICIVTMTLINVYQNMRCNSIKTRLCVRERKIQEH